MIPLVFYGRSGVRYRLGKCAGLQSWQTWQDMSAYGHSVGFADMAPPPGPAACYGALDEHGGTTAVHPIAIPDRTITMGRFANEVQPCAGTSGSGLESGWRLSRIWPAWCFQALSLAPARARDDRSLAGCPKAAA